MSRTTFNFIPTPKTPREVVQALRQPDIQAFFNENGTFIIRNIRTNQTLCMCAFRVLPEALPSITAINTTQPRLPQFQLTNAPQQQPIYRIGENELPPAIRQPVSMDTDIPTVNAIPMIDLVSESSDMEEEKEITTVTKYKNESIDLSAEEPE